MFNRNSRKRLKTPLKKILAITTNAVLGFALVIFTLYAMVFSPYVTTVIISFIFLILFIREKDPTYIIPSVLLVIIYLLKLIK